MYFSTQWHGVLEAFWQQNGTNTEKRLLTINAQPTAI